MSAAEIIPVDELVAHVRTAVRTDARNGQTGTDESDDGGEGDGVESWQVVDLGPVLRGDIRPLAPSVLHRDDCIACFYAGRVNGLHGDSAVGKSWVAEITAAQELTAGHHVIWIDLEDPDATTLVERLRILGVSDDTIAQQLHYHGPNEAFSSDAVALIAEEVGVYAVTLIVIDSLGEAFGLEGLDENKDVEAGRWLRRVARPLADAGPCLLILDHATKAGDNPLHPSGSKRKRAAITGASYLVEAPSPLTREDGGRLRLTCAKDRHGHHRQRTCVAEIEFSVYPDGGTTVHVRAPARPAAATPDAQLQVIARAAVRAAKEADRPLTQRELLELMAVRARSDTKKAGIDRAVASGALRTETGPRRSVLHVYVRDLTEPKAAG